MPCTAFRGDLLITLLAPPASPSPTPNIPYKAGMGLLKAAHPGFIDGRSFGHMGNTMVFLSPDLSDKIPGELPEGFGVDASGKGGWHLPPRLHAG